jgi:hypothetical protein
MARPTAVANGRTCSGPGHSVPHAARSPTGSGSTRRRSYARIGPPPLTDTRTNIGRGEVGLDARAPPLNPVRDRRQHRLSCSGTTSAAADRMSLAARSAPGRPAAPAPDRIRLPALFAGPGAPRCRRRRVPDAGRAAGFPSTFPPRDAKTRGTGRNRWGRRGTVGAVSAAFVLVTADRRGPMGMGGDLRGAKFAACKIAG